MSSSIRSLLDQADAAYGEGRYEAAARLYREALPHAKRAVERAWVHKNLAIALRRTGKSREALSEARSAERLITEAQHPQDAAEIQLTLGNCLADCGDYACAIPHLQRAAELFGRLGGTFEELQALIGVGRAYGELSSLEDALKIFETLGSRHLPPELRSQVLNNLGVLYKRQHRFDDARSKFKEDLELVRKLNDKFGEMVTLINLGLVEAEAGSLPEAISCLEAALGHARRMDNSHLVGQLTTKLAELQQ